MSSTQSFWLMSDDETGIQREQSKRERKRSFVSMRNSLTAGHMMMNSEKSSRRSIRGKKQKIFHNGIKNIYFFHIIFKICHFSDQFSQIPKEKNHEWNDFPSMHLTQQQRWVSLFFINSLRETHILHLSSDKSRMMLVLMDMSSENETPWTRMLKKSSRSCSKSPSDTLHDNSWRESWGIMKWLAMCMCTLHEMETESHDCRFSIHDIWSR